jgi:urease accessory protein
MSLATLLVLADGRFPAGGHAHSAGVEIFVRSGELHDVTSLRSFLRGRVATAGFVDATVASAAVLESECEAPEWIRLDREANARFASPVQREVSRTLGRRLVRTANRCWPDERLDDVAGVHPDGPHFSLALGAAGGAAGIGPLEVAVAAVHTSAATPATAAVRLLGLDPVAVYAELAALAPEIDAVAVRAVEEIRRHGLTGAIAPTAPRTEIAAERHPRLEGRLFAS